MARRRDLGGVTAGSSQLAAIQAACLPLAFAPALENGGHLVLGRLAVVRPAKLIESRLKTRA